MSIVDKIRNIFIAKKNIKNTLIEYGSDINNDTVLADYPDKMFELRRDTTIMNDTELEFAKYYYEKHRRNKAFMNSTLKTIDLSNIDIFSDGWRSDTGWWYWNEYDLSQYFYNSEAEEITLPANKIFYGNMESMFEGCVNLKKINNIDTLDLGAIYSFKRCFANCTSLESLNLSSWTIGSAPSLDEMFANCINLKHLNLTSFHTDNYSHNDCTQYGPGGYMPSSKNYNMFANCRSIEELVLGECCQYTAEYLIKALYNNGIPDNPDPYTGPCKIYITAYSRHTSWVAELIRTYRCYTFIITETKPR